MEEQLFDKVKMNLEKALLSELSENFSVKIRAITENEALPMDLMLLADPSVKHITSYISGSIINVAQMNEEVIGVYVLKEVTRTKMEIMNVAVVESQQGKGLGKLLVLHAIEMANKQGAQTVEIGTGNSSIQQIALYQKCGFRIKEIWHDYFVENYDEPIFENGIQCRDMVRLEKQL